MNDNQLLRYSRHILLPELDLAGQQKLLAATVMIIGLGGLGAASSLYLAAAGVGKLYLCDFDKVELSNLQRQIVHHTHNISQYKVDSAMQQLKNCNPDIYLVPIYQALSYEELVAHLSGVDLVLDCTDNLATRLQINKACVITNTPLVMASAIRFEGQISCFLHQSPADPCYHCIYHGEEQTNCSNTGVLAPLVGVLGSMQALEAIKIITQVGEILHGRLLLLDLLRMETLTVKLQKQQFCPTCGNY
jgi:molybdopterin-synthase adenylyltransferase